MLLLAVWAVGAASAGVSPPYAVGSSCGVTHEGYDMVGHDVGFETGSFTPEQCCEMCGQHNGCEAAILGHSGTNQGCYFKDSAIAGLTPKPGFTFLQPRIAVARPPPASTCIEWRECFGGTKDGRGDCPGDPRYAIPGEYIHAGHQCESFPSTGPQNCYRGGPDENATQEALCVPILSNGSTDFRVGHDNIIPQSVDPENEGGCIFNDQSNNRRRVFREWRAIPKEGAGKLQWVLSRSGYRVPPGAVHTGGNAIAGRTLTSSTNKGSILPGWIPVNGGIMGELQYDDNPAPGHPSIDFETTDYEIACCGNAEECTPVPPTPDHFTTPWVRFANTVPSDHQVDCEITLGGEKHAWQGYGYGVFSGWEGKFNNSCAIGDHACGHITIYESTAGKRGARLAEASAYFPPGPVLIAFRGTWPVADNTSIEVIANSFVPPADGTATVRLFNLNLGKTPSDGAALPASAQPAAPASLARVGGAQVAAAVNFGIGSTWEVVPSAPATFAVMDTATGAKLLDFKATPPLGASSVFLIGFRNTSAPLELQSQHVWLVDSPN